MDLGLLQREVAGQLGVDVTTVTNWELNRASPALRLLPGIIWFLGYAPWQPPRKEDRDAPRRFRTEPNRADPLNPIYVAPEPSPGISPQCHTLTALTPGIATPKPVRRPA